MQPFGPPEEDTLVAMPAASRPSSTRQTLRLVKRLWAAGPRAAIDWRSIVVLSITVTLAAAFAMAGLVARDDPNKWFGEGKPGTLLAVAWLIWAGVESVRAGLSLERGGIRRGWLLFGALLIVAAADDMFKGHERLDVWLNLQLGWDPDGAGDILDDLLVIAYVIPSALVIVMLLRSYALRLPGLMWNLALGSVFFTAMAAIDIIDVLGWLEESCKLIAGAFIINAVRSAGRSPLHRRLVRRAQAAGSRPL